MSGITSHSTVVVAVVVRNGYVESRHRGCVVALRPDGTRLLSVGEVSEPIFPRSCLKPLQTVALLEAGWRPAGAEQVAVAAASHSGEAVHVAVVRRILAQAGLDASALDNTPDLPLDAAAARDVLRAGGDRDRLRQNCSGKHAAMLATCVAAGWPVEGYRDPEHPVQRAVAETVSALTGERLAAVAVDGCGAPAFAVTPVGLARAMGALTAAAPGTAGRRVVDAMRAHPGLVGGTGRDVTALMQAVGGLVAKDGAEGVFVAALDDGTAVAVKIEDGAARARVPVMVASLRRLGVDAAALSALATVDVLGHGEPVGEVRATLPSS